MPIYEYRCRKCGGVTPLLERVGARHLFGPRCAHCGSRRTRRILSAFSTHPNPSMTDLLNEAGRLGPVNFVPRSPPPAGPPPGGCPYCAEPPGGEGPQGGTP